MARLNRFYTKRANIRKGSSVKLEADDASHIRKTLRLSKGDEIIIFNGEKEFLAEIGLAASDFTMVNLKKELRRKDFSPETHVDITLFQGIIKPQNFETIVEKITELGVTDIVPLATEFSQVDAEKLVKKYERLHKIILQSGKQSERIDIPELHAPVSFDDMLVQSEKFDQFFVLSLPHRKESEEIHSISTQFQLGDASSIAIAVGPEGGFSPQEYAKFQDKGVTFVHINSNILRSETAAITAIGIVGYLLNQK